MRNNNRNHLGSFIVINCRCRRIEFNLLATNGNAFVVCSWMTINKNCNCYLSGQRQRMFHTKYCLINLFSVSCFLLSQTLKNSHFFPDDKNIIADYIKPLFYALWAPEKVGVNKKLYSHNTEWRTKRHTIDCAHNTFLLLQKHLTSGTELIIIGWKIVPNEEHV